MKDERNKNKLKTSILFWIYWMTLLAGAINIYGIKIWGVPITHHTGNSSALAISIYENHMPSPRILIIIAAFFVGSFISGLMYHDRNLQAKKRYGFSLAFGGVALVVIDLLHLESIKLPFISFWVGMQNGMFIKYKGAIIRTSHVTGYLTDAGFALGAYLRGQKAELWKVKFYVFSICFFIVGGFAGYFIIEKFTFPLAVIGLIYFMCAFFYFYIRRLYFAVYTKWK